MYYGVTQTLVKVAHALNPTANKRSQMIRVETSGIKFALEPAISAFATSSEYNMCFPDHSLRLNE